MALKNVTITLDDETARWARIRAAERNTSVSKLVGQMLREEMDRQQGERLPGYERAMRDFFAITPVPLRKPGEKWPSREEIHERHPLRGH